MKNKNYLPGLHLLCGRAKWMPSQRLKRELKAVWDERSGQLESVLGARVSLPGHDGYNSAFNRDATFWTFLEQVLGDSSCREATRLVHAQRERQGRAHHVARQLQASARWDWRGRRVLRRIHVFIHNTRK